MPQQRSARFCAAHKLFKKSELTLVSTTTMYEFIDPLSVYQFNNNYEHLMLVYHITTTPRILRTEVVTVVTSVNETCSQETDSSITSGVTDATEFTGATE